MVAIAVHPLTGEMCYNGTALSTLECLLRHELVSNVIKQLLSHGLHKHPTKFSQNELKGLARRILTGCDEIVFATVDPSCSVPSALS